MIPAIPPGMRSRGYGKSSQTAPAASVATSISISPATVSFALGKTQTFTAHVLDQYGSDMGLAVTWSSDSGNVTINSSSGVATGAGYGSATITATYQSLTNTASATVQQPTKLSMVTQPAGATTGSQFTTQPVVELQDGGSHPDAESGRTVSVSISAGSGSLTGTTSVTTDSSGRAIFTNLAITATAPPSSFTLTFASTGLTGVTSSSFTVSVAGGSLTDDGFYIYTTEPVDANTVLADDFSRGSWYTKDCDTANASGGLGQAGVHGWCGTIFKAINPTGCVVNLGGGNYCATTDFNPGNTTTMNMADHDLKTPTPTLWLRYYIKLLPGYVGGAEKVLTINSTPAGSGGISIGGIGSPFGDMAYMCCPVQDCNLGSVFYYRQNQGNDIAPTSFLGHWFCVENYIKVDSGGANGEWKLWITDCGTGTLPVNPVTAPVLRASHTGITWVGGSGTNIQSIWFEAWSNPNTVGERYFGWIKAQKAGGPVGYCPLFS